MATPDKISVRFQEAIDFLRRRLNLPGDRWAEILRQVDRAASDRAAHMTDALVSDILREAMNSIEEGTGLPDFRQRFTETLQRHGWVDPSGDPSRRAALTFRVMTAQAQGAGRWEQAQRLKATRPYLRYVHVDPNLTQEHSRDEHASWHNTVLPVDHPWWDTHYPPNGFNCRCYVMSVSEADLERYGWSVAEEAPPEATQIRFVGGRPVEVPAGVDPGFAVNVGKIGLGLDQGD